MQTKRREFHGLSRKQVRKIDNFINLNSYEKRFFHWKLEFSEVFFDIEKGVEKENPGFDAVIGNPPWITMRGKEKMGVGENELNYYLNAFKRSAEYKVNSFALFMEGSFNLGKRGAEAGFIIPRTILDNKYLSKIRELILSKNKLRKVLELGSNVFESGVADSAVLIFSKSSKNLKKNNVEVYTNIKNLETEKFDFRSFPQEVFLSDEEYKISTRFDREELELLNKIEDKGKKLTEVGIENYVGIVTADKEKFISNEKIDDRYKKVLVGDDLESYHFDFDSKYVLFDKEKLWSNTNEEIYLKGEKILLRKTGIDLVSCYDDDQYFTEQSIYNLYNKTDKKINLKYVVAILNSALVQCYFLKKLVTNPESYPYIKGIHVSKLPVYMAEEEKQKIIEDKVNRIEKLKEDKSNEINSFLDWISREWSANIEDLSLKTQLKRYWENNFDEMLRIAKENKSKIDVDPSSRKFQERLEKEWQSSIEKLKPLMEKIQDFENQINGLVFDLYDLNEEEIVTVLDSLETGEEVKQDILEKFRGLTG